LFSSYLLKLGLVKGKSRHLRGNNKLVIKRSKENNTFLMKQNKDSPLKGGAPGPIVPPSGTWDKWHPDYP